jgi:hypothetical protein
MIVREQREEGIRTETEITEAEEAGGTTDGPDLRLYLERDHDYHFLVLKAN